MLISLIIPTRERATYLAECIRTATAIDDPGIEIVVSDNASTDGTAEVMAAQRDPRIVSLRTERRVSMRQNFEFALKRSRGDYVIFIGDDDGFLPRQFPALRMILERERPELFAWRPLTYGWPVPGFGKRVGGVRFHRTRAFAPPYRIDLVPARERLLRADLAGMGPTPSIYHGCASRAYLDRMRGHGGQVFGARSPDVYLSYYSVLSRDSFLYSHHPFSVNGYSPVSTGNAHHAYRSTDARSGPAAKFGAEGIADPVQDAIPEYAPSLSLNLFGTLETVVANLGGSVRGDYAAWYRYVLSDTDPADAGKHTQVQAVLDAHAERTGTAGELRSARASCGSGHGPSRRSLGATLAKLWSNIDGFKCSARSGGTNTVRTAAEVADTVLGDGMQSVVRAGRRSPVLWAGAVGRAVRRPVRH